MSVYKADAKTANRAQKNSVGFCGYDWMIDSILEHGSIVKPLCTALKGLV